MYTLYTIQTFKSFLEIKIEIKCRLYCIYMYKADCLEMGGVYEMGGGEQMGRVDEMEGVYEIGGVYEMRGVYA